MVDAKFRWAIAVAIALAAPAASAQAPASSTDTEFDEILSLDIADLTVTSVSRRPQKLNDIASAIFVVTKEDIKRTGATQIPEVLRIVPGLQVARVASNRWAVSARGFNGTLANKLLVMIDGRSIYTPVFSGTYWDDRMVPIEEVERIEVIRGPGASIWGANAMNGIIHIITKSAKDEAASYASAVAGTEEQGITAGHSGRLSQDSHYRSYASYTHDDSTRSPLTGSQNADEWERLRAGFRIDGSREEDTFMLSGNAYGGNQETRQTFPQRDPPFSRIYDSNDHSYGISLNGNWERRFNANSQGSLHAYVDHYARLEEAADQSVSTFNLDWQHDLKINDRNNFSWGLGYRYSLVGIDGSFIVRVTEPWKTYSLYSAFVQDEYALVPEELFLTVGSKFEINDFTGFEVQPSARISWLINDKQTLWAAVSRAVRTPSTIEDDINLIAVTGPGPTYFVAFGNGGVGSEELIAYELGYRVQVTPKLQLDNTAYFNDYDNLLTFEAGTPFISPSGLTLIVPFNADNRGEGHVYGFESAATYTVSPALRFMASYTFAQMDLEVDSISTANLNGSENLLPQHTLALRSYWNVTPDVTFDNMLYYVDGLTDPAGDYLRFDTRLGWQVTPGLELSLTGRNLLDDAHAEFPANPQAEIERSVIARATWQF